MTNYYVKFYYVDDMYYSGRYDQYDYEILLKEINKNRFIVLPNEKTVLNLDHIARIDIEEISR
jgi:hypothetical protein